MKAGQGLLKHAISRLSLLGLAGLVVCKQGVNI